MTTKQIKRRISNAIAHYAAISAADAYKLIPPDIVDGKLYEAHVLSIVLENLVLKEKLSVILRNGVNIVLKTGGGPINRAFSHFALQRNSRTIAELWTDIHFLSLSFCRDGHGRPMTPGDHHELDIVIVDVGATGRPRYDQIWFAADCKNTGYTKNLLREILGIRRELSLLADATPTKFLNWPNTSVPAVPPSCLAVYTTDANVTNFEGPGRTFGIDFWYEAL